MMQRCTDGAALLLAAAALVAFGCAEQVGREDEQAVARHAEEAAARLQKEYQQPAAPATREDLPELSAESDLSDYLVYAALNNPDLEAAFNRWKEALGRIGEAWSLPALSVDYAYYVQEMVSSSVPKRKMRGMAQTFPWYGKLEGRAGAAVEAANAARDRYEQERLRLFYRVKSAYGEYAYLTAASRLAGDAQEMMKHLAAVAQTKPGAAKDPQGPIRVQAELKKLEERQRTFQDMRRPVTERLNAALGRPADAPLAPPKPLQHWPPDASDEQVLAWQRDASPELEALRHEIAKAERGVALARQDYYPDFSFGLYLINTRNTRPPRTPDSMNDDQLWMFAVHVPVWFEKYQAGVREARRCHWDALKASTDRETELQAEVKVALYRLRDAERKSALYRTTLIPKAKDDTARADAAFQERGEGLAALVEARAVLLELELGRERADADFEARLGELEMLVGRDLPRTEPSNAQAGGAPIAPG